ncbi:hypothetical protein M9458_005627, partial [Cirrhinus mrigala]
MLPSHAEPTLSTPTASTPSSPAGIPLSSVLPVMVIAILSMWATHCAPEASSDHKSTPEVSSDHEFAPMSPEVSAKVVEPPMEAASIHELTATSVHGSAPEIMSDHESAPVTPEVAAPVAEPPMGAASSYELSAHHVTAKEANHELSALLWMLFVPLWVSLLLSAPPAPPWLPALPAPPWLQAPQNLPWWTSPPGFHCLPQLHGPGPPVFHCLLPFHGP